jgi:hypothetical protein
MAWQIGLFQVGQHLCAIYLSLIWPTAILSVFLAQVHERPRDDNACIRSKERDR